MTLRAFITLITLMLLGMLASGQLYICIPVTDSISDYFHVPTEEVTMMSTAFGLSYAVGFLVWGPMSDRYGRKKILMVGIILACVATVCTSLAVSYNVEIFARVAQGLCAAAIPPIALAIISEMLNDKWRPVGQSMMGFSFISSAPIAQFYASKITASGTSMDGMMLYCALAFAILAALIWAFAPYKRGSGDHRKNALHKSLRELSHDPIILTVWTCAFTALTGFVTFQIIINGPLGSEAINQVVVRIYTLLGMFTSFITGYLIRYFGDVCILRCGLALSSLTLISFAFLNLPLPLEIVILSVSVALSIPGIISIISRRASHADRGMGIAIYSFFMFVGASISPVITKFTASSIVHTLLIPIALTSAAFIMLWMPWCGKNKNS